MYTFYNESWVFNKEIYIYKKITRFTMITVKYRNLYKNKLHENYTQYYKQENKLLLLLKYSCVKYKMDWDVENHIRPI